MGGGLILDKQPPFPAADQFGHSPAEPRCISWLPKCRVGNDQGQDGACVLFAIASWASIMLDVHVSDKDRLDAYWDYKKRTKSKTDGLTPGEGFQIASTLGWLPGMRAIRNAKDLAALADQPILGGYVVTPAWDGERVSSQGCLDHLAPQAARGMHMVVIVADGHLSSLSGWRWIYIENPWGIRWAWNGIGVMSYELHTSLIKGLWIIE
jgi:hypothetical protein